MAKTQVIDTCTQCGEECVLGVNAISTPKGTLCDDCGQVKRGFANMLLPEERQSLRETLNQDLANGSAHASLLKKALIDVEEA